MKGFAKGQRGGDDDVPGRARWRGSLSPRATFPVNCRNAVLYYTKPVVRSSQLRSEELTSLFVISVRFIRVPRFLEDQRGQVVSYGGTATMPCPTGSLIHCIHLLGSISQPTATG